MSGGRGFSICMLLFGLFAFVCGLGMAMAKPHPYIDKYGFARSGNEQLPMGIVCAIAGGCGISAGARGLLRSRRISGR